MVEVGTGVEVFKLPLALFMLGIEANNSHTLLTTNDFTMFTHFFNGSTDFHGNLTFDLGNMDYLSR